MKNPPLRGTSPLFIVTNKERHIEMNYELQKVEEDNYQMENVQSDVEKARAMQEVQALVLVAQKCPRDEVKATRKIMESAKRLTLAENAIYAYPRGNQVVKGASIRTAETIAKYWGNLSFGIKELTQDNVNKMSTVMAFAWDLETNTRQEKVFQVTHMRYTKSKGNSALVDPRDIYEKVANDGARRLRACILGLIPSDVVEDFITECEKTLAGDNKTPIKERIIAMVKAFEEFGITQEMIEKRLGCRSTDFIEKHLVDLRAIYKTIKDKMQAPEAFFETGIKPEQATPSSPFVKKTDEKTPTENKCANCGCDVTTARAKSSKETLGHIYCADCENIIGQK